MHLMALSPVGRDTAIELHFFVVRTSHLFDEREAFLCSLVAAVDVFAPCAAEVNVKHHRMVACQCPLRHKAERGGIMMSGSGERPRRAGPLGRSEIQLANFEALRRLPDPGR